MGLTSGIFYLMTGAPLPEDLLRTSRSIRAVVEKTDRTLCAAQAAVIATAVGTGVIVATDDSEAGNKVSDLFSYYANDNMI